MVKSYLYVENQCCIIACNTKKLQVVVCFIGCLSVNVMTLGSFISSITQHRPTFKNNCINGSTPVWQGKKGGAG